MKKWITLKDYFSEDQLMMLAKGLVQLDWRIETAATWILRIRETAKKCLEDCCQSREIPESVQAVLLYDVEELIQKKLRLLEEPAKTDVIPGKDTIR